MFTQQTKPQVKICVILAFALAVISFILAFNSPSQAEKPATFWVTTLYDDGLPGSLRWALNESNVRSGKNFIKFRVVGDIDLVEVLPVGSPSGEVVIDGFTAPPPGITLKHFGLCVTSSNNVIRGLTITASEGGSGIHLDGKGSGLIVERNLIEGNRITGFGSGVAFNQASKNVIRDKVLVGNKCGVWFNNQVTNNNENVFEDNVIANNSICGIRLSQGFGNIIRGNYIGLDRLGNRLPNGLHGIEITSITNSSVPITGDNTVGPGNVIGFNKEHGIADWVTGKTGNTFTRNSIFDNVGMGICFGYNPNGKLPSPTIQTTNPITGMAPPNSTVEIFFDGGYQGRFFIGSVKADESGSFTSAYTLNGVKGNVTGAATDGDGNTSTFSEPLSIP